MIEAEKKLRRENASCHASIRTLFEPALRWLGARWVPSGVKALQSKVRPLYRPEPFGAVTVTTGPRAFSRCVFVAAALFTSVLMPSAGLSLIPPKPPYIENAELLRQLDPLVAAGLCTAARRLRRKSTSGAKEPKVCGLRPPRRVFEHSWLLCAQRSLARGV